MSTNRRKTAEEGSLHQTARRLGALFEGIIPSTPALIKSYGKRVSEISASPQANPKGSGADGFFANHVGIDGTSIWSAATSGAAAIAVHLLACLLARTLSPAEATSLLVEVVEERKAEIKATADESQFRSVADDVARQQIVTRAELASWDASARSWILSADEVKHYEQIQLKLITKNVGLSVNSSGNTYRNVIEAWTTAMISLEKLINGMPQSISKGAVLLGISAWHIFPDLNIVGEKNAGVLFRDALVAPGGIITLGLQNINDNDDNGVRWSLDLSYLKHYGDPVAVSVSSGTDGTRVSADELHVIAFGSLLEAWGTIGDDPIVVAEIISKLWDLVQNSDRSRKRKLDQDLATELVPPLVPWLLPLVNAAKLVLDAEERLPQQTILLLISMGRRRGREFLGHGTDIPPPLFGLCNSLTLQVFSNELHSCSQERSISILRDHAARLSLSEDECLIRYSHVNSYMDRSKFGYTTALPQSLVVSGRQSSIKVHKRWLELGEPLATGESCSCTFSCSAGPGQVHDQSDHGFQERFLLAPLVDRGCPCKESGRSCTVACSHDYSVCSYDCGNLDEAPYCAEREEIYRIAPLKLPITSSNDSWTWRNPPSGFKTKVSRIFSRPSERIMEYHHQEDSDFFDAACGDNQHDLYFAKEELYDNIAEFHYVVGSSSTALFISRKYGTDGPPSLEVEELLTFLQSPDVKIKELTDYISSYSKLHFAKSLMGLGKIARLHTSIGPATISTSIIQSPLYEARWLKGESIGLISDTDDRLRLTNPFWKTQFTTYGAKFACLAMLELGAKCNIDPKELVYVIAMSSGNSIYVAKPLLQDPSEEDDERAIKRIIGNVGRPGITMMIPPPQPRIRPLSESWLLVQHAAYDGKLEDCFHNTSLHLSFTTYEIPLATGKHGGVDAEVMLVESLISVYDRGDKVADLDVLGSLSEPLLQRLDECTCSQRASKRLRTKLISTDNWEELLDSPNHHEKAGVVKAHGNWIARLAATCISIQKGYRTVLVSKPPVCSVCVGDLFASEQASSDQSPQICIL